MLYLRCFSTICYYC